MGYMGMGAAGAASGVAAAIMAALLGLLIVLLIINVLGISLFYIARIKNLSWLQYLSGCLIYTPISLIFTWCYIVNKPKTFLYTIVLFLQILYVVLIQKFYLRKKSIHLTAFLSSIILIFYFFFKSNQPPEKSYAHQTKKENGDIINTTYFFEKEFVFIETQERPNESGRQYWGQISFIGDKVLLLKKFFEDTYVPNQKDDEYGFGVPYEAKEIDITFSRIKNIKPWDKEKAPKIPNTFEWKILERIGAFLKEGDWISSQNELLEKLNQRTERTVLKSVYSDYRGQSSTNPQ